MIRGWVEADIPHGSAIMLPDGQMFGRVLQSKKLFEPLAAINVAGDDLFFWHADAGSVSPWSLRSGGRRTANRISGFAAAAFTGAAKRVGNRIFYSGRRSIHV